MTPICSCQSRLRIRAPSNGQWVQSYIDSNTVQFTPDCTSSCPFYTSEWSGGDWFIDTPARFGDSTVTWVAQTSYLLPSQAGAAFTFQWGFILSNGAASYISPVVVAPWASQQQLIRGGTMTSSRLAIALTALIFCTSITSAEDIYLAGEARDPGVTRWISYEILGPRNHPLPIVYFSTQRFKTMSDEHLVVLPSARYEVISAYTRARIARTDCPGEEPRANVWYAVKIAEHDEKHTQRCVLPQASACDYLSGVVKLSGIKWTAKELQPITDFILEVRCDAGKTGDSR